MAKYTLLFLNDLCLGCQACEIACKQEHNIPVGPRWVRVIQVGPEEIRGKLHLKFNHFGCMHCGAPPCIDSCPVNAISKRSDGIVLINEQVCIGCMACIEVCPFNAPQYNPEKDKVEKCDMCFERVDQGLKPACVRACPTGALLFGERNEVSEIMRTRKAKATLLKHA